MGASFPIQEKGMLLLIDAMHEVAKDLLVPLQSAEYDDPDLRLRREQQLLTLVGRLALLVRTKLYQTDGISHRTAYHWRTTNALSTFPSVSLTLSDLDELVDLLLMHPAPLEALTKGNTKQK